MDAGGPQKYFDAWLESRKDIAHFRRLGKPYPVFIVAARGGGIYAAAQTATFLARMQDRCPNFSQHIFAISSVSGGSVGAAAFTSYTESKVQNLPWRPCVWGHMPPGNAENELVAFTQRDFIAPVLGAALFPDLLQRFLMIPVRRFDRATALERALQSEWKAIDHGSRNPMSDLFLDHWTPGSATPALIINTTEVETGRRLLISPFAMDVTYPDQARWFYDEPGLPPFFRPEVADGTHRPLVNSDIRVSTAAVLSARFPWVLPAATLERGVGVVHAVDGGYFDNSGIDTARDLAEGLAFQRFQYRKELVEGDPRTNFEIYIIVLAGSTVDYNTEPGPLGQRTAKEVLSPVEALLSARDARGDSTAFRLGNERNLSNLLQGDAPRPLYQALFPAHLNQQDFQLSLGFQLARSESQLITAQIGAAEECGNLNDLSDAEYATLREPNHERAGRIRDNMHTNSCQQCILQTVLTAGEQFLETSGAHACAVKPTGIDD